MEYRFFGCEKRSRDGNQYLFPADPINVELSERMLPIVDRLNESYARAFPNKPLLRIALLVEPRNGASGYWTVAESEAEGPFFVVEVDESIKRDEAILAHELAHPIVRLSGVPGAESIPPNDKRIGDELSSTAQHPFVFDLLDESGYGEEQRDFYRCSALAELEKLAGVDFTLSMYTSPPGTVWLGLWYFNFSLMVPDLYEQIRAVHAESAPAVIETMDIVRECWMAATKGKGTLKRSAFAPCVKSFQSHAFNRLGLEGRVSFKSLAQWRDWLFGAY